MTNRTQLIDVIKITDGVFKCITDAHPTVPWSGFITGLQLDYEYIGNHSGEKIISPLIEKLLVDGVLPNDNLNILCEIIYAHFSRVWDNLYSIYISEYSPTDLLHYKETINSNDNLVTTYNTINTNVRTGSIASNASGNNNIDNNYYGFNSNSKNPVANNVNNATTEETETFNNLTDKNNKTGNDINDKTISSTITKEGGSSGITPQEIMMKEIEFRLWDYIEEVFKTVDDILTVKIYS